MSVALQQSFRLIYPHYHGNACASLDADGIMVFGLCSCAVTAARVVLLM